jgi:hypothetical protein
MRPFLLAVNKEELRCPDVALAFIFGSSVYHSYQFLYLRNLPSGSRSWNNRNSHCGRGYFRSISYLVIYELAATEYRVVSLWSDGKPSCSELQRMVWLVQYLITAEGKALYLRVQCHFSNYGLCVGNVLLMSFKWHAANIMLVYNDASTEGMFVYFINGNRFHSWVEP